MQRIRSDNGMAAGFFIALSSIHSFDAKKGDRWRVCSSSKTMSLCGRILCVCFSLRGMNAFAASHLKTLQPKPLSLPPDCILLDLSLPGAYGHEICRAIRQESNVPIIVLTSSDSEFDEVMSMSVGADDYVVKPYRPAVLLARIDRALARSGSADPARKRLEHGGVSLDPVRAEVSYRSKIVELSRNELLILRILMENAGSIISRSELMDELWQTDVFVDDNTLTVNVNRLRRSLQSIDVPDDFITTRRGLGYVVR